MIYIYYYVCVICPFKMRTALKWTTDDCNNLLYIYIYVWYMVKVQFLKFQFVTC